MNEVGRDTWAAKLTNRSGQKKMRHPATEWATRAKFAEQKNTSFPLHLPSEEDGNGDRHLSERAAAPHH